MILLIDASNIRTGGGVTHLAEMLAAAQPQASGFSRVLVYSSRATLDALPDRAWLEKRHAPMLERSLPVRTYWQARQLGAILEREHCDVLFVPGGGFRRCRRPVVTMSRNLLPFEWRELRRSGLSWDTLRLLLLRITQSRAFRHADGMIFLTRYAQQTVEAVAGGARGISTIIPHGVSPRFHPDAEASERRRAQTALRLVYVSNIDVYKHQWHVVDAVGRLRAAGHRVSITFVGSAHPASKERFLREMSRVDPAQEFATYAGPVPHRDIPSAYAAADIAIFASSCENMPNILLEAMASGLPIACSDRGPMPEILGDAGVYFDPEDPPSIAAALERLLASAPLRERLAEAASRAAREYSWSRCARETFDFLARVAAGGAGRGPSGRADASR